MVYIKQVKIKEHKYWYLFHTIRKGDKFLKKSRYLGKELPKNIEELKKQFLEEINNPKNKTSNEKLLESLTPLEKKVFPVLSKSHDIIGIMNLTSFREVNVMRAVQWLEEKNLAEITKEEKEIISLDKNGKEYIKKGLPEKQFLQLLPSSLDKIKKELNKEEINVSIGTLKRKSAIEFGKQIKITENGKKLLEEIDKYENFLKRLPLELSNLNEKEKKIYDELKTRKEILETESKKIFTVKLTDLGNKLVKRKIKPTIETLTPDMLAKKKLERKNIQTL